MGEEVVCASEWMDRDHNGARGIYLRELGDSPALGASIDGSVAMSRLSGNMSRVAYSTLLADSEITQC